MQRTTWECDRCHHQYFEGDERRPNTMNDLPDRWRQVFKGGNLTYELCEACGEALKAFCEGQALIAGVVPPKIERAAVLCLRQAHARIAPFSYRPSNGTGSATTPEHELATALCEGIELLLESQAEPATCMCGHSIDMHLPPEAFPSGCACKVPSCGCLSFEPAVPAHG
jgi:hypothetical protein